MLALIVTVAPAAINTPYMPDPLPDELKVLMLLPVMDVVAGENALTPITNEAPAPVQLRPDTVLVAMLDIPAARFVILIPVTAALPLILLATLLPILLLLILANTEPPAVFIMVIAPVPPVIPLNILPLKTLLAESVVLVIPINAPLLLVVILVKLLVLIF